MSSTRFWLVMIAVVIFAAGVRLFAYHQRDHVGFADETAYTWLAHSIASGDGLSPGGRPHVHFPPGYPYAISLALRAGADPDRAGQIVSLVAGLALVIVMGVLVRHLYGARVAVVAATMLALLPDAVERASAGMSEALFALLLIATNLGLVRAFNTQRYWPRSVALLSAGVLFGMSYLVRPEGLVAAVLASAAVMVLSLLNRREPVKASAEAALVVAASVVIAMPYICFLHQVTGKWQLSGKGPFTALGLSAGVDDEQLKQELWYGLTEDGRLRADAAEELAPSMLKLFSWRLYAKRLYDTYTETVDDYTDPLFMALVGVGALAAVASRRRNVLALLPLSAFGLAVILPALHPKARYLSPIVNLMVIWAALGAVHLSERIAVVRATPDGSAKPERSARPWLVLILLLIMIPWLKPSVIDWWQAPRVGEIPLEEKTAGAWIAQNLAPDAVLIEAKSRIGHYAHRRSITTPFADVPAVLKYARVHGATHLVVTERWTRLLRPRLEPLLDPANAPPDLKLIYHQKTPDGWAVPADVLVYEILPEPHSTDVDDERTTGEEHGE